MFLCSLLSALLIYHPSLSRCKENGWHVSWHRALRGWWYVLFSSFFQMNSFFMFFLFIFYPVVVNARENNLDDIYTMLHHFQDDLIRCSRLFALHLRMVLDGFLDISISVMKSPYQPLLLYIYSYFINCVYIYSISNTVPLVHLDAFALSLSSNSSSWSFANPSDE